MRPETFDQTNNTLGIDRETELLRIPRTICSNVQSLQMKSGCVNAFTNWTLEFDFFQLRDHWRKLKKVTLEPWPIKRFCDDGGLPSVHDMLGFACMGRSRKENAYMASFGAMTNAGHYLCHLKKSFLIESGVPDDIVSVPERYVRKRHDPTPMLAQWAAAFRGELWFDGRLCYSHGAKIAQPFFPECFEERVTRMYYRRDVDIFCWFEKMKEKGLEVEAGQFASEIELARKDGSNEEFLELLIPVVGLADEEALHKFKEWHCKGLRYRS